MLVEFRKLDALGKPNSQVVVQGATLLQFSHPHVAEWHVTLLAPLANRLEATGNVPRYPVVHATVREGDKPNVFPETLGGNLGDEGDHRPRRWT